jgi:hypothetical protein
MFMVTDHGPAVNTFSFLPFDHRLNRLEGSAESQLPVKYFAGKEQFQAFLPG